MAVKSVLDIELNDERFRRFKELFDKYQTELAKTPNVWAKVGKEQAALSSNFEKMTAALMAQHHAMADVSREEHQHRVELEKSRGLWHDIGMNTEKFARSILSVAPTLAKWGSLIFGGALFGSAYGLDRMAGDVSQTRTQALGLGVSIGQLKAFQANFGRLPNAAGFLSSVGEMETDISARNPWYALGLGRMSGNTATDSIRFLERLQQFSHQFPRSLLGTEARAFQLPVSGDFLRVLRGMSAGELQSMIAGFRHDQAQANVPNALAWTNLKTQFERNWATITSTLETTLGKLAPQLTQVSVAFTNLVTSMLNSPKLAKWITDIANAFNAATRIISSPHPSQTLWNATYKHAKHDVVEPLEQEGWQRLQGWFAGMPFRFHPTKANYKYLLGRLDDIYGLPAGTLERQWQTESSGRLFDVPTSSKGAEGPFQFLPSTAKALGIDPNDPYSAAIGAAAYDAQLRSRYGQSISKALAAYDLGRGKLDKIIAKHPADWQKHLPAETRQYVSKVERGIEIRVVNNTGGSAAVAAAQLAPAGSYGAGF